LGLIGPDYEDEILNSVLESAPKVETFTVDTSTTHKITKGKAA
jgi:hypothetical protein